MGKRVILLMISIFSSSLMVWCMDDPNPQTVIRVSDDEGQKKQPISVPPIAIDRSKSNISITGRAKSIKELKDKIKDTQNTHRTARGTPPAAPVVRRKFIIDGDAGNGPTGTVAATKGTVPASTIASLTNNLIDQKSYSEDEVWALVQSCNPVLHDFGKKHNLELEDLAIFADCVQKHKVDPQVITEYLHPVQDQQKSAWQRAFDYILGDVQASVHKEYAQMEKNDPENYKSVLLDLYKVIADEEDKGQVNRSALADAHTSIMAKQLNAKESDWRTQVILNLIQVCSQAGLAAWAIYGQIGTATGHGNSTGH